jgi:hypothetical protein
MTVSIEVPPEIEAGLSEQAEAQGLPLSQYLERLLRQKIPATSGLAATPAERVAGWRESVLGLPDNPPLSDEAISRESIYRDRG